MRIIIVEDEIKIREGMAKLIERHTKHQIVGEAKNGEEGLELILRFKPDLVITDIRMPTMDGLEMLTKLNELGIKLHTVILSGYSEFEYAKKAIHLGVNDYLLKPIAAEDVQILLDQIDQCILEEQNALKGTPLSCIRDIIMGSTEYSDEIIMNVCNFTTSMKFVMFLGYIGAARAIYSNEYLNSMEAIQKKFPNILIYTLHMEVTGEIVTLMAGEQSSEEMIAYFTRKVISPYIGKKEYAQWCVEKFSDISELPINFVKLQNMMSYGISIDNNILLSQDILSKLVTEQFIYPLEIENKIRIAICNGDYEKVEVFKNDFYNYMRRKDYEPNSVVEGYLRLYSTTVYLIQEIDSKIYEQLRSKNTLKLLGNAKTRYELEKTYSDMIQLLVNPKEQREDIRNYTIKRSINYIREHYREGITLEEVARKLDITPEYLSTLFNKEVGINFTSFLKDFRLSHAKRLLTSTDLKVYEIAEKIGYNDSKYFNRVFREKFGISPGEFRQQFL